MASSNNGGRDWRRTAGAVAPYVAIAGILVAVAAALSQESPTSQDLRTVSRGIVLAVAIAVSLVVSRRTGGGSKPAEKNLGTRGSGLPVPPGGAPGQRESAARLEEMLVRSDDAVATLRDLVLHGQGRADFGALPGLLTRAGLLEWDDAPVMRATRLRRNGRWWLSSPDGPLEGEAYDRALALEAALNVHVDLCSRARADAGDDEGAALEVLADVSELSPWREASGTIERTVAFLLEGAAEGGEWSCRMRFSDICENLPAPFRIEALFQSNVSAGVLCADVSVPRPGCLGAFAGEGVTRRADAARSYALRLALLLGRSALEAAPSLGRAVVNCHEHGTEETLLSLEVTRKSLERLRASLRGRGALLGDLPQDASLRASLREDGWLSPVRPFARRDDPELSPLVRYREPELDETPCDDALLGACGARRVSDLGIMEKAGRAAAWNALVREGLGDTTQESVSKLVSLRGRTNDLTVAEACERASKALVEGSLDVSDKRSLSLLFVDGGSLGQVTGRARKLLEGEPTREDLERQLHELDSVLGPISEMGIYLDDPDSVYRYFNSLAERVVYNRTADDGGRRVRLVPDEYYAAHSAAARILGSLGRSDEALPHVEELVRVAPVTPDAALVKVRFLEEQSRIFEAADLLVDAIGYSSTARDMAICFYRLAFMEWKLGRSDLAAACYQRAIALHPDIAPQAQSELRDLVASTEGLEPLPEAEVVPALERGGLPAGPVDEVRSRMRDALVACTDAGLFGPARQFSSVLAEFCRDDALLGVRQSLVRP